MNAIIKILSPAFVTILAVSAFASGHGIPPLEISRIIRNPDLTIEKDITHGDTLFRMFGNTNGQTSSLSVSSQRMQELRDLLQPPREWNEAHQSLKNSNDHWFDGREVEAQRKWFYTFCKHWNTDIGFLALNNLKTSLIKRKKEKLAILPLFIILLAPDPKLDGPLNMPPDEIRHEACLALSDIALEWKQPDAAIYFLRLSIYPFGTSEPCGNAILSETDQIEERINLIQNSRWTHSGVRWTRE